jgi:hypothetical protein
MQLVRTTADIATRQGSTVDATWKGFSPTLAQGNSRAIPGHLEPATRDVWVAKDAAQAIDSLLTTIEDAEGLDRLVIRLAVVQKGLKNLTRHLSIPQETH